MHVTELLGLRGADLIATEFTEGCENGERRVDKKEFFGAAVDDYCGYKGNNQGTMIDTKAITKIVNGTPILIKSTNL